MKFVSPLLTICLVSLTLLPVALAAGIDVRHEIIEPLTHTEIGAAREMVRFETKEVSSVTPPSHTDLGVTIEEGEMVLRLVYDSQALRDPKLLLPQAALMDFLRNYGTGYIQHISISRQGLLDIYGPVISNLDLAEILAAAKAGNPGAQARWERWNLALLQNLTVDQEFENKIPGTKAYLQDLIRQKSQSLQKLATQAQEIERKQFADYQRHHRQPTKKLSDLVLNNDRAGVADYLRKVLPWETMQAPEARAWKLWIEAIEHPDPSRTVLGFRGFSSNEKGLRQKTDKGERKAFLAPLLNRDFEHIDQNMENFVHTRAVLGDRDKSYVGKNTETVIGISEMMHTHAEGGKPSIFLSLSASFDIAESFVSGTERFPGPNGSLLAVRIDERRAFPNAASDMRRELELLTPLIIFPDEILLYQENYDHSEASRQKFIHALEAMGENINKNIELYSNGRFQKKGFEFLKYTQTSARVLSCSVIHQR